MKELLRRGFRAAMLALLHLRSRPLGTTPAGRVLVLAPHQDDEALGCAGLILARRTAGQPVAIVYLTDGAGSHPGHPLLPPRELARRRRAEAVQAMQGLRVEAGSLHFLDAADGTLAHLRPEEAEALAGRLAGVIAAQGPTELYLPCRADGSSEHEAAFRIVQRALQLAPVGVRLLEYPVWARWSPQRLIRPCLSGRVWRLAFPGQLAHKRATLACYVSQAEPTPPWPDPVLPRGFIRCFETAEEYFFEA